MQEVTLCRSHVSLIDERADRVEGCLAVGWVRPVDLTVVGQPFSGVQAGQTDRHTALVPNDSLGEQWRDGCCLCCRVRGAGLGTDDGAIASDPSGTGTGTSAASNDLGASDDLGGGFEVGEDNAATANPPLVIPPMLCLPDKNPSRMTLSLTNRALGKSVVLLERVDLADGKGVATRRQCARPHDALRPMATLVGDELDEAHGDW